MTNYKYLGYGVTNSNGVAHLDHDPQGNPINGYTGTGAGEVDVIASTDNPISSGSIVSETYSIFDYIVYDGAVDTNHYDNWYNYGNRLTPSNPDAEGRLIENNGSSNGFWYAILYGDTPSDANSYKFDTFTLECDIVSASATGTDTQGFIFYDGSIQQFISTDWLRVNNGGHIKITYDGTNFTIESDNLSPYTFAKAFTNKLRLGFSINAGESLKYKNFKLYPI